MYKNKLQNYVFQYYSYCICYRNYHDGRIYTEGYLIGNDEIVFAVMENYQPTSSRVDIAVLEINICNGTDKLMLGGYFGTNAKCEPSLRKCYFSKKNIDFTDKMFEELKLDENEQEILINKMRYI